MRIAIVAGEPSGDVLAAGLIAALQRQYPEAQFFGIGGEQMQARGFDALFSMDSIALMGIESVIKDIRNILKIRRSIRDRIIAAQPDCFIGVDVPDFNLSLERQLREQGIKVMHYVSPSVWAWRGYRIHKIKRAVDRMLTLFPFEKQYYDQHGIPATYIGHPTASKATKILAQTDRTQRQHTIALLPGSRGAEVAGLLPAMLGAAALIAQEFPEMRFILPFASQKLQQRHEAEVRASGLPISITQGQSGEAMAVAALSIVASGTAALEAMIYGSVMVVVYKVQWLSYAMFTLFKHIDHFSLPNQLLDEPEVVELSQRDVTAKNIAQAVLALLRNPEGRRALEEKFAKVTQDLRQATDERAAQAVLELIRPDSRNESS